LYPALPLSQPGKPNGKKQNSRDNQVRKAKPRDEKQMYIEQGIEG
jgi:hypothetical protein